MIAIALPTFLSAATYKMVLMHAFFWDFVLTRFFFTRRATARHEDNSAC